MQAITTGMRLHIGIFGRRNSGKSSFINALCGQAVAITADIAGTTTDPVYKPMEIKGVGACTLIDTAGYDDTGALGAQRVEKTKQAAEKTDVAVLLFDDVDTAWEEAWLSRFRKLETPVIPVIAKTDVRTDLGALQEKVTALCDIAPICVSSTKSEGFDRIRAALALYAPEELRDITGNLAERGDVVVLVMPQDGGAPRGRLILPQVQTIRALLDKVCVTVCVTPDALENALSALSAPPKLIITDSQAFPFVRKHTPPETRLTSFSILFASLKGDMDCFLAGAAVIDRLKPTDRVLIAEACTHAPQTEDIGRVKLPAMLRRAVGEGLTVDVVAGDDFPKDLTPYALVIHCGACMFNRKHVITRVQRAMEQGVPMTNYGVALAKMNGILERVDL